MELTAIVLFTPGSSKIIEQRRVHGLNTKGEFCPIEAQRIADESGLVINPETGIVQAYDCEDTASARRSVVAVRDANGKYLIGSRERVDFYLNLKH